MKKKRKRKTGTLGDVESLVMEAERSRRKEDWVIAALAVVCYFSCRRLADVMRIKVGDVTWGKGRKGIILLWQWEARASPSRSSC